MSDTAKRAEAMATAISNRAAARKAAAAKLARQARESERKAQADAIAMSECLTVATPESEARVAKLFADMERSRLARIELGLDS